MAGAHSVVAEITVARIKRISPTFARVEFAGTELAEVGLDGPIYDQRIKLIFPNEAGRLPRLDATGGWYDQWLELPESERGAMRTYSIRDLHGDGDDRRLVVDFVLHLQPGATGPASLWASRADTGHRVIVIGPRRGVAWGGIEFEPGPATRILLAGDETAVPAITRILEDLPVTAVGHAFLEVPDEADILALKAPAGFVLRWLPRGHESVGRRLIPAILTHFATTGPDDVAVDGVAVDGVDPGDIVWETPTFSGSGEDLVSGEGVAGLYAWIAGESAVVRAVRRHLVDDVGLDRRQVAFMGYWRAGVAMRG
jgi:NADPH-dependent ferric siderophore reductase